MKSIYFSLVFLCLLAKPSYSQDANPARFVKAADLTIIGKMIQTGNIYQRLDTIDYPRLPAAVKRLLTMSAGIAVSFKTDSKFLKAKWCNSKSKVGSNMTAIAQKGLDLYVKLNGKWQFCGVGKPLEQCTETSLVNNLMEGQKEFLLYLPLYDEINDLEIGISSHSTITAGTLPFKSRILIYGSSILHGASASRSGLAYPAILSRQTGLNFINMGLSGSAKMEKEVADLIAKIDADAYILDCVPNSSPEQIKSRTDYLVQTIRNSHPKAPIIIMQSLIRESGYVDAVIGDRVRLQNEEIKSQFLNLHKKGVKDLYFISAENFLGNDHEGTVDGTHPNDLGFYRFTEDIRPKLLKILAKYNIK
ncbi:MAG: SGNH/GDSL hydrolase family protein [Pedobacter agri]